MKKDLIECFFVNVERRIKFYKEILGTILCEGKDYLLFMTCLVLSCAFIGGEEKPLVNVYIGQWGDMEALLVMFNAL